MTGTVRTTAELDPHRRKLLFRAWHRGTREMDLIIGGFADAHIIGFTDEELAAFELGENAVDDGKVVRPLDIVADAGYAWQTDA